MSISITYGIMSLLIGASVGFVLQKGRACTNTIFRNLLLIRNTELAMIIVVTIAVELLGYLVLSINPTSDIKFQSNPIEFSYIPIPLGGFLFGLGTVIAGGCAGGTCYRIGQGSVSALIAFLGFASGIAIIGIGLENTTTQIRDETKWLVDGEVPSLELFLPRWFWTFLVLAIAGVLIFHYCLKMRQQKLSLTHLLPGWNPIIIGLLIGILGTFARYFSTVSGREFGMSTTDGVAEIFQAFLLIEPIGWIGLFIIGLIIGSAISAFWGKEFRFSFPTKQRGVQVYSGGLLLGIGAMLAQGCNFGHIFGGIPELGVSSFVALLFILVGNWLGSYLYYIRLGYELPKSTPNQRAV